MQVLSNNLIERPVMSLRTGGKVATTTRAVINPNNLRVEGFHCQDTVDKKLQLILLSIDIRDIVPQGIVVNDHSVLSEPGDLVRLKETLQINFELIGKPVFTDNKSRIGKVSDFAVDLSSLYIQKIYVAQSVIKSFAGGNLSVDRSQIVEITNKKIVIQDPLQATRLGSPSISTSPASS